MEVNLIYLDYYLKKKKYFNWCKVPKGLQDYPSFFFFQHLPFLAWLASLTTKRISSAMVCGAIWRFFALLEGFKAIVEVV